MHSEFARPHVTPAAQAGYDKNGVPNTPRAKWLVSLFARKALRRGCDYLLRRTVDPTTNAVIESDVPMESCERCGAQFHKTYHYSNATMCKKCQPKRRYKHGPTRT